MLVLDKYLEKLGYTKEDALFFFFFSNNTEPALDGVWLSQHRDAETSPRSANCNLLPMDILSSFAQELLMTAATADEESKHSQQDAKLNGAASDARRKSLQGKVQDSVQENLSQWSASLEE
jgi:hypothetical protein